MAFAISSSFLLLSLADCAVVFCKVSVSQLVGLCHGPSLGQHSKRSHVSWVGAQVGGSEWKSVSEAWMLLAELGHLRVRLLGLVGGSRVALGGFEHNVPLLHEACPLFVRGGRVH